MRDMQGILQEYMPLQLNDFGAVYASEEHPNVWLSEYDFSWRPVTDDTENTPQLYFDKTHMHFSNEGEQEKAEHIKKALGTQLLRLPEVSACWGESSLMIRNDLADKLIFSPRLGVTRVPATLIDAAGDERVGYTALSFHKVFFHERITLRFADIPAEQRPIIRIKLKSMGDTFLIHKSLLAQWQLLGVQTVVYDIEEKYQSFNTLCNLDMYSFCYGNNSYFSLDDFQRNNNPMYWSMFDD